nr:hypothetical protein [Candidatus Sigynarchaeota archaeon]
PTLGHNSTLFGTDRIMEHRAILIRASITALDTIPIDQGLDSMKITYKHVNETGLLEFSAFQDAISGAPIYILDFLQHAVTLDRPAITILNQFITEDAIHDTTIIECERNASAGRDIKKSIKVTLKDALNPGKVFDEDAWDYFKRYVVKLFQYLRTVYNAMSDEQRTLLEARKFDQMLKELHE